MPAQHREWTVVAAAAVLLTGWGLFHPEFRADANAVPPAIRQELAKTGFKPTTGVSAARMETVESAAGLSEHGTSEQRIAPVDGLMTEKRTQRRKKGQADEFVGLYVGPLTVIRFDRSRPPLVGELLPYQFWSSSRMTEFAVEEADGFPGSKGGRLRARVTYEDHYVGGELALSERRRLHCEVAAVVDAASIKSGLSGTAARIDCREELEPNGRRFGSTHPQTFSVDDIKYSHWYFFDLGWSMPIEGERTVRVLGADEIIKWSTKLIAFESSAR